MDDVVVMFHDPSLERTTNGKGLIREQKWYGPTGIEHVRTKRFPIQAIPTFAETIQLLLKPENLHVQLNVDVKVWNDPTRLFTLMNAVITASHPDWKSLLAPRILLGLWHSRFITAAQAQVPYLRRSHIGLSPHVAREYFWDSCEAFSMNFDALCTSEGERFRADCASAGKKVIVWTVNTPERMMEAVRWGVHAIITDVTQVWLDFRASLNRDWDKASQHSRLFLWTAPRLYWPYQLFIWRAVQYRLESVAGPLEKVQSLPMATKAF